MRINLILRGWTNYFRHAVAVAPSTDLQQFTWWRIVRWQRTRHRSNWSDVRRWLPDPTGPVETHLPRTGSRCSTPPACRSGATATGATRSPTPGPRCLNTPTAEPVESPDAGKLARPVRRAAWGNGPRATCGTAPQADSTAPRSFSSTHTTSSTGPAVVPPSWGISSCCRRHHRCVHEGGLPRRHRPQGRIRLPPARRRADPRSTVSSKRTRRRPAEHPLRHHHPEHRDTELRTATDSTSTTPSPYPHPGAPTRFRGSVHPRATG